MQLAWMLEANVILTYQAYTAIFGRTLTSCPTVSCKIQNLFTVQSVDVLMHLQQWC